MRFKGVEDEDGMERRLDNRIYIQGMKLFVNKPKFQRDGNKVTEPLTASNHRMSKKNTEHGAYKQELRQAPTFNKLKSYAEVVTNRTNDRIEAQEPRIKIQTSQEKTKWLDNAWVGHLKNKAMFDRVDEEVRGMFGQEVKVSYWGDDLIILHGLTEVEATDFNRKEHTHGGTPLSLLQRWTPMLTPSYRLTWLCIWGVPLTVWDADTFACIVSVCGELVEMDEVTEEKSRVDLARVLIRTSEKPFIERTMLILVDGVQYSLDLREEMGVGWGRTLREAAVTQLPPSPFSTAIANSDEEPNTPFMHGFSAERVSGSLVGGSSACSSLSMEDHRRRRRTEGPYPTRRGNDTAIGAYMSSLLCHEQLPADAALTPSVAGQWECIDPNCLDMHPVDMAEPMSFCPSQQQTPIQEGDVEDIPLPAFKNSYIHRVKQDEPLVNIHDSTPLVNSDSNLMPPYQKEAAAEEGVGLNHSVGLSKSPNKEGNKLSPNLRVYVRRKEWGAVNHEAYVQHSPLSCLNGKNLVSRKPFNEISKTQVYEGRDIHSSDPEGMIPNLHHPPHSSVPDDSVSKEYVGDEEAFHMEMVRQLGVSYVEKDNSNVFTKTEVNGSSGFNAPADVMGMKQSES